jgi:hypothetical protein
MNVLIILGCFGPFLVGLTLFIISSIKASSPISGSSSSPSFFFGLRPPFPFFTFSGFDFGNSIAAIGFLTSFTGFSGRF